MPDGNWLVGPDGKTSKKKVSVGVIAIVVVVVVIFLAL